MIIRRHAFTSCKQELGEPFMTWWEKKTRKAQECAINTMTANNWLQLELLRGVNDPGLQKRLLQERKPLLKDLISIAMQWKNAENAQQSFGTEVSELVR